MNSVKESFWKPLAALERVRTYSFPDGFQYRIQNPVSEHVSFSEDGAETHFILDKTGGVHRINPGWRIMQALPPQLAKDRIAELREELQFLEELEKHSR